MHVFIRLRSWLIAMFAMLIFLCTACAQSQVSAIKTPTLPNPPAYTATAAPTPMPPPTATNQPNTGPGPDQIVALQMLDNQQGWVATGTAIWYTADSGATWQNRTPPNCASQTQVNIGSLAALDAQHVWMICISGGEFGANPATYTIYRSVDGGLAWQVTPIAFQRQAIGVHLAFLDPLHGWLFEGEGSGLGHHYMALYRTLDGGATWAEVTQADDPGGPQSGALGGGPSFVTPLRGWIGEEIGDYTGQANQFDLWKTEDGGLHWALQTLPPANGHIIAAVDPPQCFDQVHCVLPISGQQSITNVPPSIALVIYTSSDGGVSWTPLPNVTKSINQPIFVDMAHGWGVVVPQTSQCVDDSANAAQNAYLAMTTDSGQTWHFANSTLPWCDPTQQNWISQSIGWVLFSAPTQPIVNTLWHTTNGGLTWIQATVP